MFATIVNDLHAAFVWLWHELRLIGGWLRDMWLWAALLAGLLLAMLAYQFTPAYSLHIGGDKRSHLRWYDSPFLNGFNAPEPDRPNSDWWALPEPPYRWAEDSANIRLPGVGGGQWLITLTAGSGRPDGTPTTSHIVIGSSRQQSIRVAAGVRRYLLLGEATNGDLNLGLQSQPFTAPNDPRSLGVVIYRFAAAPIANGAPAPGQLALQSLIAALIYGCARRIGWRARAAAGLVLGLGCVAALLLVMDRLGLTIATPGLAIIAASCLLLAWLGNWLLAIVAHWLGIIATPGERGAAVGAVLAGFAARMAGITHPYARFSDLQFNVNNLLRVLRGDLFLTAGLPCDAGAGLAPYPPAQYVVLAPLQLLLEFASGNLAPYLVQGSIACFESTGAALIWLLLRRSGVGQRAALFGVLLYMLPLPLLRSYSIGEMANLFGQVLVPPLLLFLAAWPATHKVRRWAMIGGLIVLGLLLSHTGVAISAVCLLMAWGVLQLTTIRQSRMVLFGSACVVAGIVALLFFYSAYAHLPADNRTNAQTLASVGQICPPGYPFGPKLLQNIELGLGPQGSLGLPLVLAAVVGSLVVRRGRLNLLLAAAALGTLISFGTLLASDQPVRWAHFLYPALCIAAGIGLAHISQRGRASRVLVITLMMYLLWFSGDTWVRQIADYLH